MAYDRYQRTALEAKKTALKAELGNLRQSIILFKAMNGKFPRDLKELITLRYAFPYKDDLITGEYLRPRALDERGNILDPFGLPYSYYPYDGSVRTQKEGFEHY